MSGRQFSNELYDAIAAFGVHRGAAILDVSDGSAGEPFAQNDFPVTVHPDAEQIPFPNARFDVVLCSQNIHDFDRFAAIREMARVLKPLGIIAIWWKQLMANDGVREIRDEVYREADMDPPAAGLSGGFKEFYASEELRDQIVRVFPWRKAMPLDGFVANEPAIRESLLRRLRERLPAGATLIDLSYVQYLYLARRR